MKSDEYKQKVLLLHGGTDAKITFVCPAIHHFVADSV